MALCPQADVRQALVPVRGGILTEQGKIRGVRLEDSAIWPSVGQEEVDKSIKGVGMGLQANHMGLVPALPT
eukprot:CAMPEP_0172766582 /NCGR_PEP_ID=MMETSP1074-20121228/181460_1 /TAXON_ID=2916 /ORGANISM="Ceratium fusus, Strain PA161109" /LENGTH=70 /DNA_ID=CAMNT_0013601715 /DNA_START=185 /DNA_END=398 /DNA_ORIENTATION=+